MMTFFGGARRTDTDLNLKLVWCKQKSNCKGKSICICKKCDRNGIKSRRGRSRGNEKRKDQVQRTFVLDNWKQQNWTACENAVKRKGGARKNCGAKQKINKNYGSGSTDLWLSLFPTAPPDSPDRCPAAPLHHIKVLSQTGWGCAARNAQTTEQHTRLYSTI